MTGSAVAPNLVLTLLALGVVALLFAWSGWHAGRRWGGRGLLLTWVVGTLLLTTLMVIRILRLETTRGFTTTQLLEFGAFREFTTMWAIALAVTTLVLRRRLRTNPGTFSVGTASRSVGAFFAGIIGFFLVYLVRDILALFTSR